MRHIIVATHSKMAEGIVSTAQFIMGKQEHLTFLCAYTDACMDFKTALAETLDQSQDTDEFIILTDLMGGSVNNEAMQFLNRKGVYLITGINLALLIQLLSSDESQPAEQVITEAVEAAKDAILYCNPLAQAAASEEMEEF